MKGRGGAWWGEGERRAAGRAPGHAVSISPYSSHSPCLGEGGVQQDAAHGRHRLLELGKARGQSIDVATRTRAQGRAVGQQEGGEGFQRQGAQSGVFQAAKVLRVAGRGRRTSTTCGAPAPVPGPHPSLPRDRPPARPPTQPHPSTPGSGLAS